MGRPFRSKSNPADRIGLWKWVDSLGGGAYCIKFVGDDEDDDEDEDGVGERRRTEGELFMACCILQGFFLF